jgi:hypothetical protein
MLERVESMELKNLEIGNQIPPIVYDLAGDLACCGGPDFRLRLEPMHFPARSDYNWSNSIAVGW